MIDPSEFDANDGKSGSSSELNAKTIFVESPLGRLTSMYFNNQNGTERDSGRNFSKPP